MLQPRLKNGLRASIASRSSTMDRNARNTRPALSTYVRQKERRGSRKHFRNRNDHARIGNRAWRLLRAGIATLFVLSGAALLSGQSDVGATFGGDLLGTIFRVVTGLVEILGGLLLIDRRTASEGSILIGATMAGAIITKLTVTGGSWIPEALLLLTNFAINRRYVQFRLGGFQ